MKRWKQWLSFFAFSGLFCLTLLSYFFCNFILNEAFSEPEFPVLQGEGDVTTVRYDIDACDGLYLFSSITQGNKLAVFVNAQPFVQIVNDEQCYVEIMTNQSIHDQVVVQVKNTELVIEMVEDVYRPVEEIYSDYDYDRTLAVDCSVFDVVIHAPICSVDTCTYLELDYDASAAKELSVVLNNGGKGTVGNIQAEQMRLGVHSKARLALRGEVRGEVEAKLWHDARVNAKALTAEHYDVEVSSGLFGISWFRYERGLWTDYVGPGLFTSCCLVAVPAVWLGLAIRALLRLIRQK